MRVIENASSGDSIPIGGLIELSANVNTVPTNYIFTASGQTLLRAAYPELFAEYGLIIDGDLSNPTTGGTSTISGALYKGGSDGDQSVAFGTSADELIYTTDGGATWTTQTTFNTFAAPESVRYLNDQWVCVGSDNLIMSFSNLAGPYTEHATADTNKDWRDVAWNGSIYVVVGNGTPKAAYGADLASLNNATGAGSGNLFDVCWSGTHFVAVGSSGAVLRSTDGDTWVSPSTTGTGTNAFYSIASDGAGNMLTAGNNGQVWYSTDHGDNWSDASGSFGSTQDFDGVAYTNGMWVIVGGGTTIHYRIGAVSGTFTSNTSTGLSIVDGVVALNSYEFIYAERDASTFRSEIVTPYTYNPDTQFHVPQITHTNSDVQYAMKVE